MSDGRYASKAAVRLGQWMAETNTSQATLASLVTKAIADAGWSREKPVNQSTVSGWSRGRIMPRALAQSALEKIADIPTKDWFVPAIGGGTTAGSIEGENAANESAPAAEPKPAA